MLQTERTKEFVQFLLNKSNIQEYIITKRHKNEKIYFINYMF